MITETILGVSVSYKKPGLNLTINAIAERDVRHSLFFTTEMGRRYAETKDPDLQVLYQEASPEDRKAFTQATSWGIEEVMSLMEDDKALDLLRNNKQVLIELRNKLFGGSDQKKETSSVAPVEEKP